MTGKGVAFFLIFGIWILTGAGRIFAADITATLDSSDGSSAFSIRNSESTLKAFIDSSGNLQLRGGMRLDSGGEECTTAEMLVVDGSIGIGISNPDFKLHVNGEARITDRISLSAAPAGASDLARIVMPESSAIQGGIPTVDSSFIQFTGAATLDPGYGVWASHNAYFDGTNWRQPRGSHPSRQFTVNYHQEFAFRYAPAGGVNNEVIAPYKVASLSAGGDFSISGEIAATGTGNSSFAGDVGIGTTTPAAELDVNGDIHARNPLYWEAHYNDLGTHTTTASTIWVDYPGMTVTIDMPAAGSVLAKFSCSMFGNNTANSRTYLQMLLDGNPVTYGMHYQTATWELHSCELHKVMDVSAGLHTIKMQWKVGAGTAYGPYSGAGDVGHRTLTVIPLT
ncbi:MAG: hypothetical protein PHQ23_11070 [Candidatus Wallbacteria bacterium]|nr:hypothetical protein [Candidatus Wallbacteria bacterium]